MEMRKKVHNIFFSSKFVSFSKPYHYIVVVPRARAQYITCYLYRIYNSAAFVAVGTFFDIISGLAQKFYLLRIIINL